MNLHNLTSEAIQLTIKNDGATILKNGKQATKGYAVGGLKEFKLPYNLSEGALWEAAFSAILTIRAMECDAYGFWLDGDTLYIDAVTIFEESTEALAFAAKNDELAIFCIHTQDEIRL